MDEKHLPALRRIALLGGVDSYVVISSGELGEQLDTSQQTASNWIIQLIEEGRIVRELGARKQRIKLTQKGVDLLKREYNEYRRIFEMTDHFTLHGRIATGMGEGGYYICQPGYMEQFESKLGYKPFEGTLNVVLDKEDITALEMVRATKGVLISGFSKDGRSFGNVIAYKATIKNLPCAIVIPERSHYVDTIEIICKFHLRRTLSLGDGDRVDVRVGL